MMMMMMMDGCRLSCSHWGGGARPLWHPLRMPLSRPHPLYNRVTLTFDPFTSTITANSGCPKMVMCSKYVYLSFILFDFLCGKTCKESVRQTMPMAKATWGVPQRGRGRKITSVCLLQFDRATTIRRPAS